MIKIHGKRALSLLLTVLMLFSCMPTFSFADEVDYTPQITSQPESVTCYQGEEASLVIEASAPNGGTLSFQWYSDDGVAEGCSDSTFDVPTDTVGEEGYYCVVTNSVDDNTYTATSETATVTVEENEADYTPTIDTEPQDTSVTIGDRIELSVSATAPEGATLAYQWYQYVDDESEDDIFLDGYTDSTLSLDSSSFTAGEYYYYCEVSGVVDGESYSTFTGTACVTVAEADEKKEEAKISKLEVSGEYKTDYVIGDELDLDGIVIKAVYDDNSEEEISVDKVDVTGFDKETAGEQTLTLTYEKVSAEIKVTVSEFEGKGTVEDPYLIKTAEDLVRLQKNVNSGTSYEGMYFHMVSDITLPSDWTPIGCTIDGNNTINYGKNLYAFSGTFDASNDNGGCYTLTVPAGGLPLFGYVKNTTVKNLNIYGTQIAGAGLVNNYSGVGLSGTAVAIDNVTLKSGSSTLRSGLVAHTMDTNIYACASGSFLVSITNCTVESGVTVGYDKSQSDIGSIASNVNGTISNCSSYATVYGVDYVGGILGTNDNSFSTSKTTGCTFGGSVVASGSNVGGIVGGGYSYNNTAPNGLRPTITDCTVTGSVSGNEAVGGIFGGDQYVFQTWSNMANSISNNSFTGKVSGNKYVGAICGYINSMNSCDTVSGNTYTSDCGVDNPVGLIKYLDTSYSGAVGYDDTVIFSSANSKSDCPSVSAPWFSWKVGYNRTDDPLGANIDDCWKKIDTSTPTPAPTATPTPEPTATPVSKIKVTVKVLGDSSHSDGVIHALSLNNLETWYDDEVEVDEGSYAWDALQAAEKASDGEITFNATESQYGLYVSGVNGFYSNGSMSGWMYTVNGTHPNVGVSNRRISDGDVIVFHFTDDYTYEEGGANYGENPNVTPTPKPTATPTPAPTATPTVAPTTNPDKTEVTSLKFSIGGYELGKTLGNTTITSDESNIGISTTYATYFGNYYVVTEDINPTQFNQRWFSMINGSKGYTYSVGTDYYLNIIIGAADGYDISGLTAEDITLDGYCTATSIATDANGKVFAHFKLPQLTEKVEPTATPEPTVAPTATPIPKIKVTVKVLGDKSHTDGTIHALSLNNLETWYDDEVEVDEGSYAWDALQAAEKASDGEITFNATESQYGLYVSGVNGFYSNGSNSCWMYTVNGSYADVGITGKLINNGDVIVFHFTDDYTYEQGGANYGKDPNFTPTPTAKPTATPTVEPTATPTVKPTATPTAKPTATPTVKPTAKPNSKITVSVTVLGDSLHGDNGEIHALAKGNLTTWYSSKVTVEANSSVWTVLKSISSLSFDADENNQYNTVYIRSVNGLGEFDNGSNSGWMYTVNGTHPEVGVSAKIVNNGDSIVLHYTDDYTYEEGGSNWTKPDDKKDDDNKKDDTNKDTSSKDAKKVDKLIEKIGTVTLDSKDKIDSARKAYNNLSDAAKKKVTKLSTLEAAEKKYSELKEADNKKKADEVKDLIDNSGNVDKNSSSSIEKAQEAYNNLTPEQKALVTNSDKLTEAEKDYAKVTATDEDKTAAEKVEKLINKIGTVTEDSEKSIEAARKAYNKLSDKQKLLVENLDVLEKAEKELEALKGTDKIEDAYKTTGDYLENLGTPSVGSVGGEWMAIGLLRSDRKVDSAYYDSVVDYVKENIDDNGRLHKSKSTDNSRIILALTAMGKDVTDVDGYNLLSGLSDIDYIQKQGINGPIWALLALDSGNYAAQGNVSRDALIQLILDAQTSDGGWAFSGDEADSDMTGMAIQALAPYYNTNDDVHNAVNKALETLSDMQDSDGGFSTISGTEKVATSESCAQVIAALTALGINPDTDSRFIKNGKSLMDALLSYYVSGGGFKHILSGERDGMATEQGYYALVAYYRYLNGKTNLYDMTDVIDMGGDPTVEATAEPETSSNELAESGEETSEAQTESTSFPWVIVVIVVVACACVAIIIPIVKKKNKKGE